MERLHALLGGKKPDRIPCMPFALGYPARLCQIPLGDIYSNPELCFKAHLNAMERHGYDTIPFYLYGSFGAWELGGEIEFPHADRHQAPIITRTAIQTPDDVERLTVPDPRTAGIIPKMIEFAKLCRRSNFPAVFFAGSAFNIGGNAIGLERLLKWMIKEPDLVHLALKKISNFLIAVAQCFVAEFGAGNCIALDGMGYDSNALISSQQFYDFSLPYIVEVHERILAMGVPAFISHLCGDHNQNLIYWKDIPCGNPGIATIASQVPLEYAKEIFGERHIIAGNVNTISLLTDTPEKILEMCRETIQKGKDNPAGFILMTECELPPDSAPENIDAMVKAAREYGRLA
jgi:uroporphyrinogen decarboxylase